MLKKSLWKAGCVLAVGGAMLTCWAFPVIGQPRTVAAVVDGDRVVLSDGTRIRLLGVDAPEVHPSAEMTREAALTGKNEEAVLRQGKIAAAYLRMLALGKPSLIEYDDQGPRGASTGERRTYQPAYLYIVDQQGRVLYGLNERMLSDGYAVHDASRRYTHEAAFKDLEADARRESRGLWAPGSPFAHSTPPASRPSSGADVQSRCRIDPGCVWVGQVNGAGYWQARPGHTCACVDL